MADSEESFSPPASLALRDILDYIAPGGTFLLSAFLFEWWARDAASQANIGIHTPIRTAIADIVPATHQENWLASLLAASLGLGIAYILGHIVASVSAFLIERTFIYKAYGWPSNQLLGVTDSNPHERHERRISRCFYRAAFFWINAALITSYLVISAEALGSSPATIFALHFLMWPILSLVGFLIISRFVSVVRKYYDEHAKDSFLQRIHRTERFRKNRDRAADVPQNGCRRSMRFVQERSRAFWRRVERSISRSYLDAENTLHTGLRRLRRKPALIYFGFPIALCFPNPLYSGPCSTTGECSMPSRETLRRLSI